MLKKNLSYSFLSVLLNLVVFQFYVQPLIYSSGVEGYIDFNRDFYNVVISVSLMNYIAFCLAKIQGSRWFVIYSSIFCISYCFFYYHFNDFFFLALSFYISDSIYYLFRYSKFDALSILAVVLQNILLLFFIGFGCDFLFSYSISYFINSIICIFALLFVGESFFKKNNFENDFASCEFTFADKTIVILNSIIRFTERYLDKIIVIGFMSVSYFLPIATICGIATIFTNILSRFVMTESDLALKINFLQRKIDSIALNVYMKLLVYAVASIFISIFISLALFFLYGFEFKFDLIVYSLVFLLSKVFISFSGLLFSSNFESASRELSLFVRYVPFVFFIILPSVFKINVGDSYYLVVLLFFSFLSFIYDFKKTSR